MKKVLIGLVTASLLLNSVFSSQLVNAFNADETNGLIVEEDDRSAGLISSYSLSVRNNNGCLAVSGNTTATQTMSYIGYINITIEKSSNNSSWTVEKTIGNKLRTNLSSYVMTDYPISVEGGNYYRFHCEHYVSCSDGTQSISNTSNSVWIG